MKTIYLFFILFYSKVAVSADKDAFLVRDLFDSIATSPVTYISLFSILLIYFAMKYVLFFAVIIVFISLLVYFNDGIRALELLNYNIEDAVDSFKYVFEDFFNNVKTVFF